MAKLLQFTGVLVLFACSLSLASGEPIEIPDNACFWRGGKYGQMIYCDPEEIAIGACGSGKSDDCDKGKKLPYMWWRSGRPIKIPVNSSQEFGWIAD